jgi:glycosyltransferase involved in cell wall biosynthesis
MPSPQPRSCVIVVENLPVPFDRRVWQEAQALHRAGWIVSVICPTNDHFPKAYEIIDDIAIYRHPLPAEGRGAVAYFREYATALFHEFRLLFKVHRERGFSIIQACNPPDLIFLAALPFKLMGKRFIYDQHDVSPELFVVKFGNKGFLYRALMFFERMSYLMADQVITANATFKEIAISRGGKAPSKVEVVYGVPDRLRIRRVEPEPGLHGGRKFILGYVGIINEQDGVDHLVRAVAHLIKVSARALEVEEHILFTGYLKGETLLAYLSAFDIGVIPDPLNEANDLMSMNKVFEYCALGIPTACYPLKETKRLLGEAGVYAPSPDPAGLAQACLSLMQDESLRTRSATAAAKLSAAAFVWENEARKYVATYERVLSPTADFDREKAGSPSPG